jgi:hypothetical protein
MSEENKNPISNLTLGDSIEVLKEMKVDAVIYNKNG